MNQSELKFHADSVSRKIDNALEDKEYFSYPYQHIILDDFLEDSFIDIIHDSFPDLDNSQWEHSNDEGEIKSRTNWTSEFDIPEGIVDAIRVFNSAPIIKL